MQLPAAGLLRLEGTVGARGLTVGYKVTSGRKHERRRIGAHLPSLRSLLSFFLAVSTCACDELSSHSAPRTTYTVSDLTDALSGQDTDLEQP